MREATINELEEIFGEVIDLSGIKMLESSVLGEDIAVDSKEMLRILSRIESRYKFRFNPREVLGLKTIGDILETVQRRTDAL
jgi:acyl carrier protein